MHWSERSRAVARIGEELQRRGWDLYGYHADQSDLSTDYHNPASWRGVAVKDGVVVGVDVSSYDAQMSGKPEYRINMVPDVPCEHCAGTGIHPDGLTYDEAVANPAGQHALIHARQRGGTLGHPHVVSPLHYHGVRAVAEECVNPTAPYGAPICLHCAGRGYTQKQEQELVRTWPTFRPTPKGKTWHVEREGRIVASGVGLQACAHWNNDKTASPVRDLCDRIEAAAFPAPRVTLAAPATTREQRSITAGTVEGDVPFTVYEEGDWTWIAFGRKPSEELRDRLKRAGARWGKRRGAWRFTRTGVDLAALGLGTRPAGPVAEADPEPAAPATPAPWTMTQRAYQESKAQRVAGVPIMNARDGRDHEASVRQAVAQGLPVPAYVLACYPDLVAPATAATAPAGAASASPPVEPAPVGPLPALPPDLMPYKAAIQALSQA
ncbi:MAG: hypothetical protein KKA73_06475, partial [Chloroflexi bacterium]|nr:hypothetical protein [Chloroflexota bacterium]